ncbi:hypothetical protein [Fodinicurvata sp. EGI_FJ10296]|uniref:hypothetical protein n=1 Tax=Fodinicurvata sp. EGI_FJ10296 TaxID=3231908 RepID=UPI0034525CB2
MSVKLPAIWIFGVLAVLLTGLRYPTEGSTVTVVFASPPTAMLAIQRLAKLDAVAVGTSATGRFVTARFDATPSPGALRSAGILLVLPGGGAGCRGGAEA